MRPPHKANFEGKPEDASGYVVASTAKEAVEATTIALEELGVELPDLILHLEGGRQIDSEHLSEVKRAVGEHGWTLIRLLPRLKDAYDRARRVAEREARQRLGTGRSHKVREPKAPKVREPKAPKAPKVREPKPPKAPKVREPKEPKEPEDWVWVPPPKVVVKKVTGTEARAIQRQGMSLSAMAKQSARANKLSEAHLKFIWWTLTAEQREEWWKNHSERSKIAATMRWQNMSPEERESRSARMSEANKARWGSMSPEERQRISEEAKERWARMTPEARQRAMAAMVARDAQRKAKGVTE